MGSILHCISLLTRFLTAMVVIAEISDDGGCNGDDRPQKPQEEAKKPQQQVLITQRNCSFYVSIPNEIIDICIARAPRSRYPSMSLVSKYFHRLITSPELYRERLSFNVTESVLYGLIGFLPPFGFPSWYILHRLHLHKIDSLPPMPYGSAVVTIGYEMYVIGGFDGYRKRTRRVILIDCTTHTWRFLPMMTRLRFRAAAGVIDGKIYVIGGREKSYPDWVEAFDVKTQAWSPVPGPYPLGTQKGEFEAYAVMGEKIYLLDCGSCFSYEPNNGEWESCERLRFYWHGCTCVVDDMLYTIDPLFTLGSYVILYDPDKEDWSAVKGVGPLPSLLYYDSKMANFGGKLVILGVGASAVTSQCMFWENNEIGLERGQGGDIWGKIESAAVVLTSLSFPFIELCHTVTI